MHIKQRQQKFIDGPFGKEEIMVDDDSFFIIIDELLVALSQFFVHFFILRGELFYSIDKFLLLEFVIFDDRLL